MRHFTLPTRRKRPTPLLLPLTAASYLALRRTAAGVSQADLARALIILADNRRRGPSPRSTTTEGRERFRRFLDNVRLLEKSGSLATDRATLTAIASLFPFDPAVYHQLAKAPNHHPRICRSCGCSGHDPCIDDDHARHDAVCRWITPALCSHCVDRSIAVQIAAQEAA